MSKECEIRRQYDRNIELLREYRMGSAEAGEQLAILNEPLVYSIAGRFSGRGVDMSDLVECGTIGLVKAINTFDTERGCAFSTYAVPLIFGEIRRFLRDDGLLKVSREEKRLCAILNAERERRSASGESCAVADLAASVGVSAQDAAMALCAGTPVRSLDERAFDDDDSVTLGAVVADEEAQMRDFDRIALRYAIDRLPSIQRELVLLRYYRDFSQTETARILGLSQVKVSREEKKIMRLLREMM